MSDPARFDTTIHAPHRLRICALLVDVKEVEFATLRELLDVSDSVLSKQLAVLTEAGYVQSRRARRDRRQRVWLALTVEGRDRYDAHVAALRDIVGAHDDGRRRAQLPGPAPSPFPGALPADG